MHPQEPTTLSPAPLTEANRKKLQKLLFSAIWSHDIPAVHRLIFQGADPAAPLAERPQMTPLMSAAEAGSAELLAFFLPFNKLSQVEASDWTALHLFIYAIATHKSPTLFVADDPAWQASLRSLISAATANAKRFNGMTPMMLHACHHPHCSDSFDIIAAELLPFIDRSPGSLEAYELCASALASDSYLGGGDRGRRAVSMLEDDPGKAQTLAASCPTRGTLAHIAARKGQLLFLEHIAPLVELNARDIRGRTPLMTAVSNPSHSRFFGNSKESIECMRLLLGAGADPSLVDNDGCDALMIAIEENTPGIISRGIEALLAPLIERSTLSHRDHLGESALDKAIDRELPLIVALIQKALRASELLSELCPTSPSPNAPIPNPRKLASLLHRAIDSGDVAAAGKHIAQGACLSLPVEDDLSRTSQGQTRTPLMRAAAGSNPLSLIRLLLPLSNPLAVDHEANSALMLLLSREINSHEQLAALAELASPESALLKNSLGLSPLTRAHASANLSAQMFDILRPLCDWFAIDDQGFPVLSSAILGSRFDERQCLDLWSEHPDQAWLANSRDYSGRSLAHIAAMRCKSELLKAISFHVNFDATDNAGLTPLMSACCGSSWRSWTFAPAIEFLAPRSNCRLVDLNGCDALMLLIETCSDDPVHAAGELIPRVDLAARDFLGESALDKARNRGFSAISAAIEAHMAIFAERDNISLSTMDPRCSTQCPDRADRPLQHRI